MDEAMNPLYILGVPLGYVMEWIYKLIPNYGWVGKVKVMHSHTFLI